MGVDYDAAGGIGIRVTDEMLKKMGCDPDGDIGDFLDGVGVTYCHYGDLYSGRADYAWIVDGDSYLECVENISDFLKKINDMGFEYTEKDLEIIVEALIW